MIVHSVFIVPGVVLDYTMPDLCPNNEKARRHIHIYVCMYVYAYIYIYVYAYEKVLAFALEKDLDINPSLCIMDFQIACMNVIQLLLPNIQVKGCLFRFSQSLLSLGLTPNI